ncbi:hypothetical protein NDU88_007369 [Pleurodeles waltl]|uniref:Myb/SANT-like DNA-binding domain-containing protein n=1 Tax=Pleurodeles waltl TaxID=8319 RepID=A0AAV7N5Q5_PLEWA|nr:hypothetical protein NDU88_007369 [Pleurodeles waltl]
MVEEISRVEPQLFSAQVQQIARKKELWQRIVDRVNSMGTYPWTRDDIRKRWNDLRGKVRSIASRHQVAIMRTGCGPPPPPLQLTAWKELVLAIQHPEGLTGGQETVTPANGSSEHVPQQLSPPPEDAVSDDSNSVCPDPDDLPGSSGTTGQLSSTSHTQSTTGRPPSNSNTTAATQRPQTSVPWTHKSIVCPPVQGPELTPPRQDDEGPGVSRSGYTVQRTEAQGARGQGKWEVSCAPGGGQTQGTDCPGGTHTCPGAYQQSQDTMGQVITILQENQWLQGVHHREGIQQLQGLNANMASIAGVLGDMANTMHEKRAHQQAPSTSQSTHEPTTSAAASGQEDLPHHSLATSFPPSAEGEPPHKHFLRPTQTPETVAKTKTTARK